MRKAVANYAYPDLQAIMVGLSKILKKKLALGIVVHVCNPSTREAEAGRSQA
jgi:hypothetical protein